MILILLAAFSLQPLYGYTDKMNDYFTKVVKALGASDIKKYPQSLAEEEKKVLEFLEYQKKYCLGQFDQALFESIAPGEKTPVIKEKTQKSCFSDLKKKHIEYLDTDFSLKKKFLEFQRETELSEMEAFHQKLRASLEKEYSQQVPLK
jgi:hypothetical protein